MSAGVCRDFHGRSGRTSMDFLFLKQYSLHLAGIGAVLTAVLLAGCGKASEEFLREAEAVEAVQVETGIPQAETGIAENGTENVQEGSGNIPAAEIPAQQIYVDLCGAVVSPGVYSVMPGSRLFEVIELAGGLKEDAAVSFVNRASFVEDGQKITIPTIEEAKAQNTRTDEITSGDTQLPFGEGSQITGTKDERIDLNSAGIAELMTLPGIGEAKAKAIVRYREENGPFGTPEDLMKVGGIKQAVYDGLRDSVAAN